MENSFSLNCIKVNNKNTEFYPSFSGGISVISENGNIYHPWSETVKFKLISIRNNSADWLMYSRNNFYFHYSVEITVNRNNCIIHYKQLNNLNNVDSLNCGPGEAFALYLDRSDNSIEPHIIGVPYLTLFNVLYSNDCFVSMYFDWYKTNASQLIPYNSIYSKTSVYYSQYALYNKLTNGKRNMLDETIILKASDNIDEVFPDINNPVSEYYNESTKRIIYDDWQSFNKSLSMLSEFKSAGITNIWHILHDWQKGGYDVSLPDVFPANDKYGGNTELKKISDYNKENNNLFALHENYIDIFKTSSKYSADNLALSSDSKYIFNWYNPNNFDSSFIVKPEKVLSILSSLSNPIHSFFYTTASYHDVSSSYDPSKFVDYDYKVVNAGKFIQPYNTSISIADSLRKIHKGPVSGEGLSHYLYAGYYDDFSAQMHTAKSLPGAYYGQTERKGGFYKPLFVNFDLMKIKSKTFVHGMGFYERFFYKDIYWQYMGRGLDSALMYAATEIAFGHGAFVSSVSSSVMEQAKIEYNFVYPIQLLYSNAKPIKILYHDLNDNKMYTASDYIRKYPDKFDEYESNNFMSQIFIEYDNNLKVYINRNPNEKWAVEFGQKYGYMNYHNVINNKDSLFSGNGISDKFILPAASGWFVFYPL